MAAAVDPQCRDPRMVDGEGLPRAVTNDDDDDDVDDDVERDVP
jgi:hypothetical protein